MRAARTLFRRATPPAAWAWAWAWALLCRRHEHTRDHDATPAAASGAARADGPMPPLSFKGRRGGAGAGAGGGAAPRRAAEGAAGRGMLTLRVVVAGGKGVAAAPAELQLDGDATLVRPPHTSPPGRPLSCTHVRSDLCRPYRRLSAGCTPFAAGRPSARHRTPLGLCRCARRRLPRQTGATAGTSDRAGAGGSRRG